MTKRQARTLAKAFNILHREGDVGSTPNTKFNYGQEVGDGLNSPVLLAVLLWIANNFLEAPLIIEDLDGEAEANHTLLTLWRRPNEYYGEAAMRFALALDFKLTGNAYLEIERKGPGGMPSALYYQPSTQIEVKGTKSKLITHYVHTASGGREIAREDIVHFRMGLDPRNQKAGLPPMQALLREVFTDNEAAQFTASVLRNFGLPGIIVSPADEGEVIGPKTRSRLRQYFKRMFTGDRRGEAFISRGRVNINTLDVDLSKVGVDKLRQIPEERVTAVLGVPAAVVGFGTGIQQTKVGATMKELRELAVENSIVPMYVMFDEEINNTLLPEFETDETKHALFDITQIRALQEDENARHMRVRDDWKEGLITRAEARRELGQETTQADEVFRLGLSQTLVPAGQLPAPQENEEDTVEGEVEDVTDEQRSQDWWNTLGKELKERKTFEERQSFVAAQIKSFEELSNTWADDLLRQFESIGSEVSQRWLIESRNVELRNEDSDTKDVDNVDREVIEQVLLAFNLATPNFEEQYLRTAQATVEGINTAFGLGVMLDAPLEREIVSIGGSRMGLIDMTEDTRSALFSAVEEGRAAGMAREQLANHISSKVSAGPWSSAETRSMVIARTETKWAQNEASLRIYGAADTIQEVQVFDAQGPGDQDDACLAIDGRIMTVDEARAIPVLEHPNCTRSFAPLVNRQRNEATA